MKKYKLLFWSGIAAAVVIFVLVNVFMTVLTKKTSIKIDLTSNKRYELTDATYDYLKEYDADTVIYILASVTDQDTNTRAILDRYAAANSHIKLENVDVEATPAFGREFVSDGEILEENSVIVSSGDKFKILENEELYAEEDGTITGLNTESKITSALKYVSSDTVMKAYFTTGHDEDDFAGAKDALDAENYETAEINTLTDDIPDDASVVIASRPLTDFTTAELAKVNEYLSGGGSFQLYLNSECGTLPNITAFAAGYGIGINNNIIAETRDSAVSSDSTYIFLMNYVKNDVTESLISSDKIVGYKPFSKSLTTTGVSGAVDVNAYLTSTDESYTTSDFDNPVKSTADSTGAADIALMSENTENGGKLYVSGTTMLLNFAADEITGAGFANAEYFTAVTDYMTGAGSAFVVPVKTVGANRITMRSTGKRVMFSITVILVPLLLTAGGVAVFFRRRNM